MFDDLGINNYIFAGSVIIWLGLITGIAVLVAISLDGSNFFNP